jgi:hypothetical protein
VKLGGTGLTLAVLSAATFGTSGTFASSLIHTGWSPAAAVLVRVTLSALLLTISPRSWPCAANGTCCAAILAKSPGSA